MAADGSEAQLTSGLSYNPIFGELVGDSAEINDNLVGVVAYGIYKIAKREWLTEFKARCGREPTTEEVTNYTLTWTKSRKDALTFAAESSLAKFADTIISDAAPGIREAALRGTFWSAVWTSIFASALYTLFLIALAIILAWAGIDAIGLIRAAGGISGSH